MIEAAMVSRVSSREQQQEGFSIEAQAKLLREYADRNGFEVVKAFEGVETAKAPGRKHFFDMVTWLKRNRSCRVLLVEKTDRLYRNFRDAVTLEDLDLEIHFVKEGSVVSKDSKSQTRLIQGIRRFDHPDADVRTLCHRSHSLTTLAKTIKREDREDDQPWKHTPDPKEPVPYRFDDLARTNLCRYTPSVFGSDPFRSGASGPRRTHPAQVFETTDCIPWFDDRAYDGCMMTGDVQKEKYFYYRCTGHRGKYDLPRSREEDLANRLGSR
jgi:hypothetical protein